MSSQMLTSEGRTSSWKMPVSFVYDEVLYAGNLFSPETMDKIKRGDVSDYDVLVATYPRSGTARLLEICSLLLNDCDVQRAETVDKRHTFLELARPAEAENAGHVDVATTHLNFQMLEKVMKLKRKTIFGIRNPKDTLVSFYHFHRMAPYLGLFTGTWSEFFNHYVNNEIEYGDFFNFILSWWAQRNRDDIMVVTYEDLNTKPLDIIKKMAEFLGKDYSDAQLLDVANWISFSNMRDHPQTNLTTGKFKELFKQEISPYMRNGKVGDWKNYFTKQQNAYIDERCEKLCKPVGLTFQFD